MTDAIAEQFGIKQMFAEIFETPVYPVRDGGEYIAPTVGKHYEITWAATGATDPAARYLGRGKFQLVEDYEFPFRRASSGEPYKVQPHEVEYIEEIE